MSTNSSLSDAVQVDTYAQDDDVLRLHLHFTKFEWHLLVALISIIFSLCCFVCTLSMIAFTRVYLHGQQSEQSLRKSVDNSKLKEPSTSFPNQQHRQNGPEHSQQRPMRNLSIATKSNLSAKHQLPYKYSANDSPYSAYNNNAYKTHTNSINLSIPSGDAGISFPDTNSAIIGGAIPDRDIPDLPASGPWKPAPIQLQLEVGQICNILRHRYPADLDNEDMYAKHVNRAYKKECNSDANDHDVGFDETPPGTDGDDVIYEQDEEDEEEEAAAATTERGEQNKSASDIDIKSEAEANQNDESKLPLNAVNSAYSEGPNHAHQHQEEEHHEVDEDEADDRPPVV